MCEHGADLPEKIWGIIEFNKCRLVGRYLDDEPPVILDDLFEILQRVVAGSAPEELEVRQLREGVLCIRQAVDEKIGMTDCM